MPETPDPFIALAQQLADASGPVARRYFRSGVHVEDKPDLTPVTRADREAETAMRALIEAAYPDHGIIGEEHGSVRADAEYVWVLDPIDGTRSFIAGLPLFGTLIALCREGRPVLGVIDHPALNERWVGAVGRPTTCNGQPVRTRGCASLAEATLYTTAPDLASGTDLEPFLRCQREARVVRHSTDCYGYAMVASGYGDMVIEAIMSPYDFLALAPVVGGAGGIITDWQGAPVTLSSDGRVIACGDARLHQQVLELFRAGD